LAIVLSVVLRFIASDYLFWHLQGFRGPENDKTNTDLLLRTYDSDIVYPPIKKRECGWIRVLILNY